LTGTPNRICRSQLRQHQVGTISVSSHKLFFKRHLR
jgi:hypothetical protein